MTQKLKLFIAAGLMVLGVGAIALVPTTGVYAQSALEQACEEDPSAAICQQSDSGSIEDVVQIVVNILLFIVGLVAVIMIIVSGIRFVTSGGDSGAVASAKNTLLYSVIGLVVAFLAFAIVSFVLNAF